MGMIATEPVIRSGVIILIFIGFDILFGLLQALTNKVFESRLMRTGLFHKLGEILAYIFGVACNITLPMINISLPFQLSSAITIYIVVMEIGSIVENLSKLSPAMGKYLGVIFKNLKPPDDLPEVIAEEAEDDAGSPGAGDK